MIRIKLVRGVSKSENSFQLIVYVKILNFECYKAYMLEHFNVNLWENLLINFLFFTDRIASHKLMQTYVFPASFLPLKRVFSKWKQRKTDRRIHRHTDKQTDRLWEYRQWRADKDVQTMTKKGRVRYCFAERLGRSSTRGFLFTARSERRQKKKYASASLQYSQEQPRISM